MCHSVQVISKTKSGELSICETCKVYHLEFNNIYLELNTKQFLQLKKYIMSVEIAYWEHKYSCSKMKRKIPLPSLQENLVLMFNRQEVTELKILFSLKNNGYNDILKLQEIDYMLIVN